MGAIQQQLMTHKPGIFEFAWDYDLSLTSSKLNSGTPQETDSGAMTSILDVSGNGVNLIQNTANAFINRNALYKNGSLGCVRFQGTFLGAARNATWPWPTGLKEFGIINVFQETAPGSNYAGVCVVGASGAGNDSDNTPPRMEFNTSYPGQQHQFTVGVDSSGILNGPSYAGAKSELHIWGYYQSLTGWEIWRDNIMVQSGSKDFAGGFLNRLDGVMFGNRWSGGGVAANPYNGNWCQSRMIPRATNNAQRIVYQEAMVSKWIPNNLVVNSSDFVTSFNVTYGTASRLTLSYLGIAAPIAGTFLLATAVARYVAATSSGVISRYKNQALRSVVSGESFCLSIYARQYVVGGGSPTASTVRYVFLKFSDGAAYNSFSVFDLQTGLFVSNYAAPGGGPANANHTATSVGSGWYRFSCSHTFAGNYTNPVFEFGICDSGADPSNSAITIGEGADFFGPLLTFGTTLKPYEQTAP